MARQLAMSTVVAWFGNLSFDQQKNALDRLQGEHDQSRSAKRAELVTQLAALGYAVAKKAGSSCREGKWRWQRRGAEGPQGQGESQVPRSEDERNLVGRGRMASWLKSKARRRREDRKVSRLTVCSLL